MKTSAIKFISLMIAILMLIGAFAACSKGKTTDPVTSDENKTENVDTEKPSESETKTPSVKETDSEPVSDTENSTEPDTCTDTNGGADSDTESETKPADKEIEGKDADIIELSNSIKNGVNTYYTDGKRNDVTVENLNMLLGYNIKGSSGNMQITHLSDRNGNKYIENTMDVVLNMQNGSKYYASKSLDGAILNIFRLGFYYYETRFEGQTFMNEFATKEEHKFNMADAGTVGLKKVTYDENGALNYLSSANEDTYFYFNGLSIDAATYPYLELTAKIPDADASIEVYIASGQYESFSASHRYLLEPVEGEEYVTYVIPIADYFSDYTGTVKGVRFDINTPVGTEVSVAGVRLFNATYSGAPEKLSLQRSFLTYSTKLHHLVQLSTAEKVSGVASVDFLTEIAADTVDKLVVKDAGGLKYSLDGVDWATAEYVGFDIKGAGIFGYILPYDGAGGTISVTLDDEVYTVVQSKVPENGELIPSAVTSGNANDFFMGQRIYTDSNHDFDAFIHEAECERHPLTAENFVVDGNYDSAKYVGYNSLRGYYQFNLAGTNFNKAYYGHPNRQFRVSFKVTGDTMDRTMYFMTHMSNSGAVECAVLLDEKNMLIPVPLEVCKNFGSDGDKTIFDMDDFQYSDVFFPMIVNAEQTREYSAVHLYQNWGIFPLKQISSIEYHQPFYHLSTGVTETNCIVPYAEAGPGLPDHRAMSAPFWASQPQHTSGGGHTFLRYTDANGQFAITNNTTAVIDSYGPTYSDITLNYVTSDNRVEASYTYSEMPQTDENRTYLELSYKFLEDVSFTEFADKFILYACTDNNETGTYQRLGYLDENNVCQIADAVHNGQPTKRYVLGDECPYFTLFDMDNAAPDSGTATGYVNISFMIYNYEIIANGEKIDTNFIIRNANELVYLSLNLDTVEFKKGDTIKINALMMPWGSHELDDGVVDPENGNYEYTMYIDDAKTVQYMDKNVRDVRENSLLNPFKANAISDCKVVESVYVPKLRTTNGDNAEFTISGGYNNATVRIYGFDTLTAPTIEEYVNGKWIPYKVMSMANRDEYGYGYLYDGYMVHYDGDGTYSYSFVIDMGNGETERKFRICDTEEFNGWPKVPYDTTDGVINTENDLLNVYVDPNELNSFALEALGYVSALELKENDDGSQYIRYFAKSGVTEGFIYPFKASANAYASLESTGQYAVVKYRLPSDNPIELKNFQFFASTENEAPIGPEKYEFFDLEFDDEWHVLILDLSKLIPGSHFKTNELGEYFVQFLRIDIFNMSGLSEDVYLDIAYVGLDDSLEEIYALNEDMAEVILVTGRDGSTKINPKTGEEVGYEDELTSPFNVHLSPKRVQNSCSGSKSMFTAIELADDNSFLRLYANSAIKEAYVNIYSASNAIYEGLESTGQYVVFKYRAPKDDTLSDRTLEIFTNTEADSAQSPDNTDYRMITHDGEWHVVILDIAKLMPKYCVAVDGKYKLQFLRFDFFDSGLSNDYYMDIAYIAICDNLEEIYEYNKDMDEVLLSTAEYQQTAIDPKTGEAIVK